MNGHGRQRDDNGFSLLELLGVLAVVAVLAAIILPFLILSVDKAVYDRETVSLAAIEHALERSLTRHGYLTNAANLASQIAAELGTHTSGVATNGRGQPRFFLVDPAFQIGPSPGLPFRQNDSGWSAVDGNGSLLPPVHPRLMIVTSLGEPLTGVNHGPPAVTNDFNDIWNSPVGVVPSATMLAHWPGKASDLRIKRVNLSALFVRLLLTSNQSSYAPRYSLSEAGYASSTSLPTGGLDAYFLRGSVLQLYNYDSTLDSKQVLLKDGSFVYDQNVWRGSIDASISMDGVDLRALASQFLGAFPNGNGSATPGVVVQTMIDYFNAYRNWAEPPSAFSNDAMKDMAKTAQATMMTAIQGLYALPIHAPSEAPCP